MQRPGIAIPPPATWAIAILSGAGLAVVTGQIWELEARWFAMSLVGLVGLAVAMMAIARLPEMLLRLFLLCIPLASIEKWFFFDISDENKGNQVFSGVPGVGPTELIILALGATWFCRVFVTRTAPIPVFQPSDKWVLLLLASYVLSIWGAPEPLFGGMALAFLSKHALLYLFLSRNLEQRHMPWLLFAVLFALFTETGIGIMQSQLGLLQGLARDKGAGEAERQSQYEVPGIESFTRAEGTTFDSHSLGLYLAMLLPLPMILGFREGQSWSKRLAFTLAVLVGIVGLVLTFSRSAWLSFLISVSWACFVQFKRWRNRMILPTLLAFAVPLVLASPWLGYFVYERFTSAPDEIMTARYGQYEVAAAIWADHLSFGFGVGNYMEGVRHYNVRGALELPVHNVLLWILAESGLFGAFAFFGMIFSALWRLWRVVVSRSDRLGCFALAQMTALIAYLIDGLTDPLFREPVVYMNLWLIIAASTVLPRWVASDPPP